jgi:hypothetical protein
LVENGIFLEADAQAIKELAHEYEQLLKTYREQNDPRSDACPFINTASDLKGRYDAMNASWLAYRAELVKRLPMQPTPKASGQ